MTEDPTISTRVLDALVVAGLLTTEKLVAARSGVDESGLDTGEVLLEQGAFSEEDLARVLEHDLGVPRIDLASYAPDDTALRSVPPSLAREYQVVPLFDIEGTLTVAVGSPRDVFGLDALARELGFEVEAVLADPVSVAAALEQCYGEMSDDEVLTAYAEWPEAADLPEMPLADEAAAFEEAAPAEEQRPKEETQYEESAEAPTAEEPSAEELVGEHEQAEMVPEQVPTDQLADEFFEEVLGVPPAAVSPAEEEALATFEPAEPVVPFEPMEPPSEPEPAVAVAHQLDLDVLAVADPGRVAMLVSELVSIAVKSGASGIHVLPYKDEFFVVQRIGGRLEQLGRAPISFETPLVDGLLAYAGIPAPATSDVVVRRTRVEVSGRPVVLELSLVPTVSGRRLVIGIKPPPDAPRALEHLGMTEAEAAALGALAERGRGLVVLASPVGGGRSETYYALLARAAASGRTVYSVERSVDRQIDAIAQVAVGSGKDAARYLAAGLLQDTDVVGLDSAISLEEVHLALEAAHAGKLVVLTTVAGDSAEALARLLGMGVDPTSLASELVLAVGQRVVNTVCPDCAAPEDASLAAKIPGADASIVPMVGMGCDACGRTGLGDATGLFEVLPVTDPLRTVLADGGSASAIEEAALAAGMRPLVSSGLARVESGLVSAGELDRVLRFAG